jgi:hypothetical protein
LSFRPEVEISDRQETILTSSYRCAAMTAALRGGRFANVESNPDRIESRRA